MENLDGQVRRSVLFLPQETASCEIKDEILAMDQVNPVLAGLLAYCLRK